MIVAYAIIALLLAALLFVVHSLVKAQREQLKSEFAQIAANLLAERQQALADANRGSVRDLFADLKEKLDKYEREVGDSSRTNVEMGARMAAQVANLQRFADEARSFTAALVGGSKVQGNKGEEILANILEGSGLRKGVHYDVQTGGAGEGRPDVSIYDARNRYVILLDSKMNIKDYIDACGMPDDAAHRDAKARSLKAHADSVRRQVDNLASKNYPASVTPKEGYTNLPLVAMFCPFDAVLESALAVSPSLAQYAYEKGVVLVTPLTLWGYLWLISWGWKQEEVKSRYDEIQRLGGDVAAALDMLLNDMESVGDALARANEAFASLRDRVNATSGRKSVRRVGELLLSYGVAPKGRLKQLSASVGNA